jgi:hypothetical protein
LPPGSPMSVLPIPQSLDYERTYRGIKGTYGWFSDPITTTHELFCDQGTLINVRSKTTGAIDFVLPKGELCGTPVQYEPEVVYPTQPIIFVLSPDNKYYAITDSSQYTALYDAQTGDRIARMNFYGIELSFSEDNRTLITMGRYATATWDIPTLIANSVNTG